MIKVYIKKENEKVKEITLTGHAMYDDYGKDIVCASCSCIVITTVNGILRLNDKSLTVSQNDDLKIIINAHDSVTETLIDNMIILLSELEEKYKKNIKIMK